MKHALLVGLVLIALILSVSQKEDGTVEIISKFKINSRFYKIIVLINNN